MYHNYNYKAVIGALLLSDAVRATKYISPTLVIRATRRIYKYFHHTDSGVEILLTIGKPNYKEREFVALCKKAKMKFPINKIQLKYRKNYV